MPSGKAKVRYLLMIYRISLQKGKVLSVDLARSLEVSRPSVHKMMTTLANEGFVSKDYYGEIYLTDQGLAYSGELYDDYCAIYRFFRYTLKMDKEMARNEAINYLSNMSDIAVDRLVTIVKNSTKSKV